MSLKILIHTPSSSFLKSAFAIVVVHWLFAEAKKILGKCATNQITKITLPWKVTMYCSLEFVKLKFGSCLRLFFMTRSKYYM